jgi:hypothetical protein
MINLLVPNTQTKKKNNSYVHITDDNIRYQYRYRYIAKCSHRFLRILDIVPKGSNACRTPLGPADPIYRALRQVSFFPQSGELHVAISALALPVTMCDF